MRRSSGTRAFNRNFRVVALTAFCAGVVGISQAQADPGGERAGTAPRSSPEAAAIDAALHAKVKDGWYKLSIIPGAEEVVLEGQVDNERTKEEVLAVARATSSKPVRDQMSLRPAIPDAAIQADIHNALEKEYPSLVQSLHVAVNRGVVHLTGSLHNHRQIDEVLATIMMQEGVREIESDVTINGRPYTVSRRGGKK